jgi:hypothetical protein
MTIMFIKYAVESPSLDMAKDRSDPVYGNHSKVSPNNFTPRNAPVTAKGAGPLPIQSSIISESIRHFQKVPSTPTMSIRHFLKNHGATSQFLPSHGSPLISVRPSPPREQ